MHDRHGAKQPERFDPARAARLDDPERFAYVPLHEVLALLDPPHGTRLLDFGTGTGTYAIAIAKARPDLQVTAFDEQPQMLDYLRSKLEREALPNLSVVLAAANADPVAERVLALNVLHELGDDALEGIAPMVAREGKVLFVDWNADAERPVGPPRDHVYSLEEARNRIREHGFSVLEERLLPYHYALLARPAEDR